MNVNFTYEDACLPTFAQRRQLTKLMYLAFLEIRILGRQNQAAQAGMLADALHNVPMEMWSARFSFGRLRQDLTRYQQRYPRADDNTFNYLSMLEQMAN